MSIKRSFAHAVGALVITGVAGAALAAPAAAIVIPCDPERAGDCTSAIPQPAETLPADEGIAVEELVLGAVLAVRRRTPVAHA